MDTTGMTEYFDGTGEPDYLRAEVLECLVEGLQFLKGDASMPAQKLAKRILANIIIEHLEISGFSIHRKAGFRDQLAGQDSYSSTTPM